jgi:hypothetical protein
LDLIPDSGKAEAEHLGVAGDEVPDMAAAVLSSPVCGDILRDGVGELKRLREAAVAGGVDFAGRVAGPVKALGREVCEVGLGADQAQDELIGEEGERHAFEHGREGACRAADRSCLRERSIRGRGASGTSV